jgi:hypothetical protein
VTPDYPRWFRPMARLAEARPAVALTGLIATLFGVAGIGFVLGRLLR